MTKGVAIEVATGRLRPMPHNKKHKPSREGGEEFTDEVKQGAAKGAKRLAGKKEDHSWRARGAQKEEDPDSWKQWTGARPEGGLDGELPSEAEQRITKARKEIRKYQQTTSKTPIRDSIKTGLKETGGKIVNEAARGVRAFGKGLDKVRETLRSEGSRMGDNLKTGMEKTMLGGVGGAAKGASKAKGKALNAEKLMKELPRHEYKGKPKREEVTLEKPPADRNRKALKKGGAEGVEEATDEFIPEKPPADRNKKKKKPRGFYRYDPETGKKTTPPEMELQ